jgi:multidrug resistance efflux pump
MSGLRHGRIVIAAIVGAVVLIGGVAWWLLNRSEEAPSELQLYGNVDIREVALAFNATGRIQAMAVDEGDRVVENHQLATLDARRLSAAVDESRARVQAQQQVLARLKAGSRPEEINRARAESEVAEALVRDTALTLKQTRAAFEQKAATKEELDHAQAANEAAQGRLKAAQQTLTLAFKGPREEDIAEAAAVLESREAELSRLRLELADTCLNAPVNGIIQNRILQPGDMASPDRPAFTVAITDPIWVRAYVSETDLGKVWIGMKATVRTDSFPDQTYDGWIGFISPTAEFTPKSVQSPQIRTSLVYQVRVFVHNPQNQLRLGMPATVSIPLNQSPPVSPPREAAAPSPPTEPPAGADPPGAGDGPRQE